MWLELRDHSKTLYSALRFVASITPISLRAQPEFYNNMPLDIDALDPPELLYTQIHYHCFFPAKLGPSAASIEERKQHPAHALLRSTESVKAGADRGNVDDMLEYAIRYTDNLSLPARF